MTTKNQSRRGAVVYTQAKITTMTTLYDRLKRHFKFLGERPVTEADLFAVCADRGCNVVFAREINRGVYVRHADGSDHIFLNPTLSGLSLVYVFAHEAAHMLLHVPTRGPQAASLHAFDGHRCSRINHLEAETAAALLMFPRIEAIDTELLENADRRYTELIALRLHYLVRYGK